MSQITVPTANGGTLRLTVPDGPVGYEFLPPPGEEVPLSLLRDILLTLLEDQRTMSDNIKATLAAQDAKLDQLTAAAKAEADRSTEQAGKLTAAETARDQAVSDLTTTKTALADVQAQLAARPDIDSTALEAALKAEGDKVDGVIASLSALNVAPVPATPAPAEPAPAVDPMPPVDTAPAEPAPVAAEPTPAPAEPAPVDPAPAPVAAEPAPAEPAPATDPSAPTGVELTPTAE